MPSQKRTQPQINSNSKRQKALQFLDNEADVDGEEGQEDDIEGEENDADRQFVDDDSVCEDASEHRAFDQQQELDQDQSDGEVQLPSSQRSIRSNPDYINHEEVLSSQASQDMKQAFLVSRPTEVQDYDENQDMMEMFYVHFVHGERALQNDFTNDLLAHMVDALIAGSEDAVDQMDFRQFFRLQDRQIWTPDYLQKEVQVGFLVGLIGLQIQCLNHQVADSVTLRTTFDRLKSFVQFAHERLSNELKVIRWKEGQTIATNSYEVELRNLNDLNPTQRVLLHCLSRLQDLRYKRYQGNCYRQIEIAYISSPDGNRYFEDFRICQDIGIPVADRIMKVFPTGSWRNECSIQEFIFRNVRKETEWRTWQDLPLNTDGIVWALDNGMHPEFPQLEPNRRMRSFRNGVLDSTFGSSRWIPFNLSRKAEEQITCCKHYDVEFPSDVAHFRHWYHIPTPAFEKILEDQKYESNVKFWIYAIFGRLIYPLNAHDHFEVIGFAKGDAGTGKSSMGFQAAAMFMPEDVATLSSNIEEQFGLSAIFTKLCYICQEVTKDWKLPKSDTQSIITGDFVSVATKSKTAKTIKWDVPGLFFGNQFGPWLDFAGALARRFFLFLFTYKIKPDPEFQKKLDAEIAPFILKCQMAYAQAVAQDSSKDFWAKVPQYFRAVREKESADLNPLKEWVLQSGNFEICKNEFGQIDETQYVSAAEFISDWKGECKSRGMKCVVKTSEIDKTLTDLDIKIEDRESNRHTGKHYIGLHKRRIDAMDGIAVVQAPRVRFRKDADVTVKERETFIKAIPLQPRHAMAFEFCTFISVCGCVQ
jgi:phage/plasmid-associated DNA primase